MTPCLNRLVNGEWQRIPLKVVPPINARQDVRGGPAFITHYKGAR